MSIFHSSKIMRYCHTATLKAWIQGRKSHLKFQHLPCQDTRRTELPKHPAGSALTNRDNWWLSQEDLFDIMFKEFQTCSTSYTSNPSFLYTRVKSRWHSYLVLVYISPVLIYLWGTVIAMYFDHGGHCWTGSPCTYQSNIRWKSQSRALGRWLNLFVWPLIDSSSEFAKHLCRLNGTQKARYMNTYIKWFYENMMHSTHLFFDISLQ